MDSARRMRCLMWRFNVSQEALATGLRLQYSFAHGDSTEGAWPALPSDSYLEHRFGRPVGLCQIPGHETRDAPIPVWNYAVHGACARGKASLSGRLFQRLDQRSDTNENGGRLRDLVRGCAAS